MSKEPRCSGSITEQIEGRRTSVEVATFSITLHVSVLEGEDGVSKIGLGDTARRVGDAHATGPDVVSKSCSSGFEVGGNGQPAEFDSAPGGEEVDGGVVVEVVHGEVHEGVLVGEDDLIHNQTVELLVGSALETSDGECVMHFSVSSKREP